LTRKILHAVVGKIGKYLLWRTERYSCFNDENFLVNFPDATVLFIKIKLEIGKITEEVSCFNKRKRNL
jgi:hypothetical protein